MERKKPKHLKTRAPASGPGWGGAKKGNGNHDAGPGRPSKNSERWKQIQATKIANAETLYKVLTDIALNGEFENNRVNAATNLLNRIEGAPVQRNVNHNREHISQMTDDEIAAEIRRLEGKVEQIPEPITRTIQ